MTAEGRTGAGIAGGLVAVSIGPGGQVAEQTRSRIKTLQNCSLCITTAAEFHLLEDRLLLLIHHTHPGFTAFGHDRHGGDAGPDGAEACFEVHVGGHPDPTLPEGLHARAFPPERNPALLFTSSRSAPPRCRPSCPARAARARGRAEGPAPECVGPRSARGNTWTTRRINPISGGHRWCSQVGPSAKGTPPRSPGQTHRLHHSHSVSFGKS